MAASALAGCGGAEATGPSLPSLRPGRYVLETVGGEPAPFVYYRVDYADTLAITFSFAFDTIRIVNDTDFNRHFRREVQELRPGLPTAVVDAEEFDYSGIILDRGDEVKLTTRTGSPGGTPIAYFAPRDTALARHTQIIRYLCGQVSCSIVFDRRVDAWYARR